MATISFQLVKSHGDLATKKIDVAVLVDGVPKHRARIDLREELSFIVNDGEVNFDSAIKLLVTQMVSSYIGGNRQFETMKTVIETQRINLP